MKHSKDYIKLVLERKMLIIALAIIVATVSVVLALSLPEKQIAESTLVVNRINREASEDFQFDNYYSIQSAEYISNTVVGFLASADIAELIYNESGVENSEDAHGRVKNIKSRQKSSHLVNVKIYDASRENAEHILDATVSVLNEKIANLETTKDGESAFELTGGDTVFSSTKINPYVALITGLVGGLLIGIAVAFLKEYFSSDLE